MLEAASLTGTSPMGDARVYAYEDSSGSRSSMTIVQAALICFTPSFRPGTPMTVRAGAFGKSDCDFERPLLGQLLDDDDHVVYPLAIAIEDLAVTEREIELGTRVTLEVAALAEELQVFADDVAYQASGTPMAVESLIPSGLFAIGQDPDEFTPTPRILMSGEVTDARMLRHTLFDIPFCHMVVASHGADFHAVVGAADLEQLGITDGPPIGSIVSGTFWLSGRMVRDDAS
jgi:hypothetical protein